MKINSKPDFHSLVSNIKHFLLSQKIQVKTTRLQELFAKSLGFNSANGLLASIPCDFNFNQDFFDDFNTNLRETHNSVLKDQKSFLNIFNDLSLSNMNEFSEQIQPVDKFNIWYLTESGWINKKRAVLSDLKIGVNVYAVVESGVKPYPSYEGYTSGAYYLWDSSACDEDFDRKADELIKKFGNFPDSEVIRLPH